MDQKKLAAIAEKAKLVASTVLARDEAVAGERVEKARMLAATIEAVRPALAAVSSRIHSKREQNPIAFMSNAKDEEAFFKKRGLRLAETTGRDGLRRALFLLEDGELAVVTYESPSDFPRDGHGDYFTARLQPISADDAVASSWNVEACLDVLEQALDQQLAGGSDSVTDNATRGAEKMRAINALLKK